MGEVWRLLPHHAGSTELHFRLADALVRRSTQPTIWSHSGSEPTLLLGAGQRLEGFQLNTDPGLGIVRRQSGGTAILAGGQVLGVDVSLPRGHPLAPEDVLETYQWFGETWVDGLERLGVKSRAISVEDARYAPDMPPNFALAIRAACFGTLSPWEVLSGGRKLVGLAQVRRQNAVLLQSAVHLELDARGLADVLMPESAADLESELRGRAAGLSEVSERDISIEEIVAAFALALMERHGIELQADEWTQAELLHAGVGLSEL